jgi:hypothetical protein
MIITTFILVLKILNLSVLYIIYYKLYGLVILLAVLIYRISIEINKSNSECKNIKLSFLIKLFLPPIIYICSFMYKTDVIKYFRKIMYYITESSIYKPIEHTNEFLNCLNTTQKVSIVVGSIAVVYLTYACYSYYLAYRAYKNTFILTNFEQDRIVCNFKNIVLNETQLEKYIPTMNYIRHNLRQKYLKIEEYDKTFNVMLDFDLMVIKKLSMENFYACDFLNKELFYDLHNQILSKSLNESTRSIFVYTINSILFDYAFPLLDFDEMTKSEFTLEIKRKLYKEISHLDSFISCMLYAYLAEKEKKLKEDLEVMDEESFYYYRE